MVIFTEIRPNRVAAARRRINLLSVFFKFVYSIFNGDNVVAVLVFLSLTSFGNASLAQPNTTEKFVGTWLLQNIESRSDDGEWVSGGVLGEKPLGIIVYDSFGNMAVQLARRDRTIPDTEGAPDQLVNGYVAYFGKYEVDTRSETVTHHRSTNLNPKFSHMSVVRHYQFVGDTLTLTVSPDKNLRVIWVRQK